MTAGYNTESLGGDDTNQAAKTRALFSFKAFHFRRQKGPAPAPALIY